MFKFEFSMKNSVHLFLAKFLALALGLALFASVVEAADFTAGGWFATRAIGGKVMFYDDPFVGIQNLITASSLPSATKISARNTVSTFAAALTIPSLLNPSGGVQVTGPFDKMWTFSDPSGMMIEVEVAAAPTEIVPSGYRPNTAWSATVLVHVSDDVQPISLTLTATPATPTAGITPASSTIRLGTNVSFILTKAGAAASGNSLAGPSLSLADPSSPVVATPPLGTSTYTYLVKGTVSLSWVSNAPTGTFKLTPPGKTVGGADDLDVTGNNSWRVTIPGKWTITQTNSAGSLSAFADVSFPTASASATVTVLPAVAVDSLRSTLNTPTPSVGIAASPESGRSPLASTVSWTMANVGGFSVTRNSVTWASLGASKLDTLGVGTYTYQITGQPLAYSATLSWQASGAQSYRVTGGGFDSGWISATTLNVGKQGTYVVTAASEPNGGGATANASVVTPAAPVAVSASTTVTVAKGVQIVTVSPTSIDVAPYDELSFSAAGGHTEYVWGGLAFGGGAVKQLTAPLGEGDYEVKVQDPGNADWAASNVASATLHVRKRPQPALILRASTPQIYASTQVLSCSGGAASGNPSYAVLRESSPGIANLAGDRLTANSGTGWVDLQATLAGGSLYQTVSSQVVRVYFAKAPQQVSLSPSLVTVQPGGSARFDAAGAKTSYAWGGLGSGAGNSKTLTAPLLAGDYRVSVQAVEDANYQASPIEQATLRVDSPVQALLAPRVSEAKIEDSSSPLNGRTFRRLWDESGEWCAYLGRDGLQFEVSGHSGKEIVRLELQTLSSEADAAWTLLAAAAPATKGLEGTQQVGSRVFSVRLGEVAADNPLVPLSFQKGVPLTGVWRFRARVQDVDGRWSDWTAELPVRVQLPLVAHSEQLQTLPPAGTQGAWFKASETKNFEFQVWVP
jgi:hypothetical protein